MILNAYTVLDAFLVAVRLILALLVLGGGLLTWRRLARASSPEARRDVEDRSYLLFLVAGVLLALNVAAWPVFYLLLQSYVPQWPGVMCIYGVTRIGMGSVGASSYLPGLVNLMEIGKPALVFLGGAWLTLYLINRRTFTGPLLGRVLIAATAFGLIAVADAVVEGAYLGIPKTEEFLSTGCCTVPFDSTDRFSANAILGEELDGLVTVAYFSCNSALALALLPIALGLLRPPGRIELALFAISALVAVGVSAMFLVEVGAPRMLGRPHHCPYDLLPEVPESVVAIALFLLGILNVGWAGVAGWFGRSAESKSLLPETVRTLLTFGMFGIAGSTIMIALELVLA